MNIWVEKYRPRDFESVVGNRKIIEQIKKQVETNNMTHMLFVGEAGIGKTTVAKIIAHKLLGDFFVNNFMELNASDERGIDIMREKVKEFAKAAPIETEFRIILLDEADHLTKDAQASLRRIMEKNANNCRFILCANYEEKIIKPIKSRNSIFKFRKIDKSDIENRINEIIELEGKKITNEAINEIVKIGKGDLRKVINTLQTIASGKDIITDNDVKDIEINENYKNVIKALYNKKLIYACNKIEREDIPKMHNYMMNDKDISNNKKAQFSILCAKYETMLNSGVCESVVLSAFVSEILLEKIFVK